MKKVFTIIVTLLAAILLSVPTMAADTKTTINSENIKAIQGIVSPSYDPSIISIDTIDGNGWVLEVSDTQLPDSLFYIDDTLKAGDKVVIVYNDMGTDDIYDDELITIVKVI